MSTLTVKTLEGFADVNNIISVSSGHVIYTPGSVVQVVNTTKTDTFSGTSNTTELLVTGMAATITPKKTSSKILCTAVINHGQLSTTYKGYFKRNGVKVGVGDTAGSRQTASSPFPLATDTNQGMNSVICFLDSPGTTVSLTYQLYVINDNATAFNLNRSNADADSVTGGRYVSTITLMEIAQ